MAEAHFTTKRRPRRALRGIGVAMASMSLVLQPVLPAGLATSVAYAEEATTTADPADTQELYDRWTAVLNAMDAEAEARAQLNNAQSKATELAEGIEQSKAEIESLDAERERLATDIEELVEFANSPNPGNKAYADAIMDVVDAVEDLTQAQDRLGEAKSAYATARQTLADLNAELSASEDGQAMEQAQSDLDVAKADLDSKTTARDDAQAQLTSAEEELTKALGEVSDDTKKSYEKAQASVASEEKSLSKATDARTRLESRVADDRTTLESQGDAIEPYTMSELGTSGEYMDGIDISTYQDGINLSKVPADFVIVKALEGPNPEGEWYRDDYESKVDQALDLGKCVGFYHFYTTNATPKEQAEQFVKEVSDYVGETAFFLDWESRSYSGGRGSSPVAELDPSVAKVWLDTVYELTGVKPGIYMSRAVTSMHDWSEVAAEYPLWVAAYPSTSATDGYESAYREPYDGNVGAWDDPLIWQYSSTTYLDNWRGWLDVNVMYGNKGDWDKLKAQNWQMRLEKDEARLADAIQTEEAARTKYEKAVDSANALSTEIRSQSASLDSAFALVSDRTASLDERNREVDEAKSHMEQCETTLSGLQSANEELLGNIAQAEKDLGKASDTISECDEAIEKAQDEIAVRQRKKDMFRRIFELATGDEMEGQDGKQDDASETKTASLGTETTDGSDTGSILTAVVSAFVPTVAYAETTKSVMPEGFPGADEIISDPSVLDSFIEESDNADIKEFLTNIKADAVHIGEIENESDDNAKACEKLEQELGSLNEQIPELEQAVSDAQANVESARQSYGEISPNGSTEAPAGYKDTRRIPDTGRKDRSLVLLWLGMFTLMVVGVVVVVMVEERLDSRR